MKRWPQAEVELVNVGRRLRQVRRAKGMSQHEFAAQSGIAQSAISQIENSVRLHPNLATVLTLEKALGDSSVRLYTDPLTKAVRQACEKFLASELEILAKVVYDGGR